MTSFDEDLPGQDQPRLRRGTRVLLVTLAVTLAAVGLVIGVSKATDESPRSAPTGSTSIPTTSLDRTPDAVSPCDETGGGLSCRVSIGVPIYVVTAIRDTFPRARLHTSYTLTGRDRRIYNRRLSVFVGHVQVYLVLVSPGVAGRSYVVSQLPNETLTTFRTEYRTDAQHVQVRIQVRDPDEGQAVDRAALEHLARDPRLLAAQ